MEDFGGRTTQLKLPPLSFSLSLCHYCCCHHRCLFFVSWLDFKICGSFFASNFGPQSTNPGFWTIFKTPSSPLILVRNRQIQVAKNHSHWQKKLRRNRHFLFFAKNKINGHIFGNINQPPKSLTVGTLSSLSSFLSPKLSSSSSSSWISTPDHCDI